MKHILMFFTDQQRYDTISAHGNPAIQTPNLDALARESIIFERAITPSPVCVPARLSMFSGQYPARTGNNNNNKQTVYKGEGFYSRITAQGYQSCAIGKMHHFIDRYGLMGFEKRFTQEEMYNPKDDYMRYVREKHPHVYDVHGMRSEMYFVPQISQLPASDHPTQWIGDRSVEYIENCDPEKPMFLVSSFIHPHPPYCPPAPWNKLYRNDPPAPFAPAPEDLDEYWELVGNRHSCKRLMISEQDALRLRNFYYACVSFVDYQVGRIIKALKDKGMYDDTLILYTSDHGDMLGDYHAFGKRTMMESACHVPFILRYPGHGHEVRTDPCSLVDVAPTLLSYVGVPYDKDEYDGVDLMSEKHDYVYSQYGCGCNGTYMITDGKNKLVRNMATGRYFFFDSIKEGKNTYSEDNAKAQEMKVLLDAYHDSDANPSPDSKTNEPQFKHPHYVGRMDHQMLHDLEAAEIPEGYHIDLEI